MSFDYLMKKNTYYSNPFLLLGAKRKERGFPLSLLERTVLFLFLFFIPFSKTTLLKNNFRKGRHYI
jgi:hypothetical protein